MSGRDWKYETVEIGTFGTIVLVLALPIIFIVATIGSAISMLRDKDS